jgi:nicotinamide-nucleotide amidase
VVMGLLTGRGLKLSILETNTLGSIFQSLKSVAGAGGVLGQGLLIADKGELAAAFPEAGPVIEKSYPSQELARRLAEALRARAGADLVLAVVGNLEADLDPYSTSAGRTYMALAGPEGCQEYALPYGGLSELVRRRATVTALDLIRLWLLKGAR